MFRASAWSPEISITVPSVRRCNRSVDQIGPVSFDGTGVSGAGACVSAVFDPDPARAANPALAPNVLQATDVAQLLSGPVDAVVVALKTRTCPVAEAVATSLSALTWLRASLRECVFRERERPKETAPACVAVLVVGTPK